MESLDWEFWGWKRESEPEIATQRSHLDFAEGASGNISSIPTYLKRRGILREFSWESPRSGTLSPHPPLST